MMNLQEQEEFFKRECSISDFLVAKEEQWKKMFEVLTTDLEKIREEGENQEDKIEEFKEVMSEALGFVHELIQREISRNSEQEVSLEQLEKWQVQTQELIANMRQGINDINDQIKDLKHKDLKNFQESINATNDLIKLLSGLVDRKLQIDEISEKRKPDWTKILLALLTSGGLLYLILEKLLTGGGG